ARGAHHHTLQALACLSSTPRGACGRQLQLGKRSNLTPGTSSAEWQADTWTLRGRQTYTVQQIEAHTIKRKEQRGRQCGPQLDRWQTGNLPLTGTHRTNTPRLRG